MGVVEGAAMRRDSRQPWQRLEDESPRQGPGFLAAAVRVFAVFLVGGLALIGTLAVYDHRQDFLQWILGPIR